MDVQVFNYGMMNVRAIEMNGEPWFVAKDVCSILGIQNSRDATTALDDDEKGVGEIYTPGGNQQMTIINESGLYALVIRSNKPEAKAFKRWITHEVIPAIRKQGGYIASREELFKSRKRPSNGTRNGLQKRKGRFGKSRPRRNMPTRFFQQTTCTRSTLSPFISACPLFV